MNSTIKTKITSGVAWSIFMRWSLKFVGFINTLILARLLSPADFGLVAMATLLICLLEELSTVNVSLLLIRTKGDTNEHNNTAWTVSIIQSVFVAAALVGIAPYAASYFNDARVIDIIYILAIVKIIVGARNIGLVIARKNLDFALDYRFTVYSRLTVFVFVLGFSLYLQNYWGIVYGTVVGEIFSTYLSFRMHPYRPKLCAVHMKEYILFAIPMIPLTTARELNNKLDVYIVGGITNTATMGIYNVANELASTLIKEIILPTSRGLFPNFALLKENTIQFNKVYLQTIGASAIYCFPAAVGVWFVADDLVHLLLGDQWSEGAIYIRWLAIFAGISSITIMMSEHSLIAINMEAWANRIMWIRLTVLGTCVYFGYLDGTITGIAMGVAVSAVINLPLITIVSSRLMNIPISRFVQELGRPFLASIVMGVALYYLPVISATSILNLALVTFVGATVYTLTLATLGKMSGNADNVELLILRKLREALPNRK